MNKGRSQKMVEMILHKRVNQPLCDQENVNVEHLNIDSVRTNNQAHTNESATHRTDGRTTINSKGHLKLRDFHIRDCADLKVPSYLLPLETLTSGNDKVMLSSINWTSASSLFLDSVAAPPEGRTLTSKVTLSSNEAFETKLCEPSTSGVAADKSKTLSGSTMRFQTLFDDLEINSSEPDPFPGDDEDKDPDFQLSDNIRKKNNHIVDNSLSPNEAFETKLCEPSTSGVAADKSKTLRGSTMRFQTLFDDLEISSSEPDPFAGDDEDKDPDFQLSENIRKKNNHILDRSPEQEVQKKKSRKRAREPEVWRRNKIKISRNSGKSYVNWKGNIVAERKVKDPCACRLKCTSKISEENRKNILSGYWGLSDLNRQRDYISKYVICQNKARNRKRKITERQGEDSENDESSRKQFSFVYLLPLGEGKVKVCKTFFLNTLNISAQTVRTVFNKLGSSGVICEDKRGKVCKNSMLDESVKQSIRDHINCFETVESHYCRSKTKRLFLPPTLNICKMYNLYEGYCADNGIPRKATESMYRTIFNTEFNMSFFQPKKDLCDICHRYENGSAEEKLAMDDEYQLHMKHKNLARDLKNADKERAKQKLSLCCAVFDLQQILSVPKSEVGLAYYKLKLSTYNFTVFNLTSKDAFCYMWYECIGNRGSSEIGSCLLLFIEDHIQKGVNEFSFYSDNCAGQNRNKYLFSLYNYCSQKYKIKIRHTFLEKGHTQSEGDSVHSVIEKAARNVPIYTPEQWYTLVRTCKRKQPYIVIELGQENIWNLKNLQEKTSINWEKNEQNEKVVWNKMKIVEANFEMPNIILYKYTYDEQEAFQKIIISKKGRKSLDVATQDFHLKRLHTNLIPLSKKKYDHLKFLCDKKVILNPYHNFFKNLPFSQTNQTSNNTDDE